MCPWTGAPPLRDFLPPILLACPKEACKTLSVQVESLWTTPFILLQGVTLALVSDCKAWNPRIDWLAAAYCESNFVPSAQTQLPASLGVTGRKAVESQRTRLTPVLRCSSFPLDATHAPAAPSSSPSPSPSQTRQSRGRYRGQSRDWKGNLSDGSRSWGRCRDTPSRGVYTRGCSRVGEGDRR